MKVLFIPKLAEHIMELARASLPQGVTLETVSRDASEDELLQKVANADIIMGYVMTPFSIPMLQAMHKVKLVQLISAGYDKVNIQAMRELHIPVATNGGANSVAVSEHTLMLILALYRKLTVLNAQVKLGQWLTTGRPGSEAFYELEGKTVGLVGLGGIGREVAKRLRAFDTVVLYFDPIRLDEDTEKKLSANYTELNDIFSHADIVSLHCPLNPETQHMIGRSELSTMKKSAILINTSRGGLLDHDALYEALQKEKIAGAGLDVIDPIPPPANMPLLSLPNVIFTPHTAGTTVESWPKRFRNAFENVCRVAAGQCPLWVIPELRDSLKLGC